MFVEDLDRSRSLVIVAVVENAATPERVVGGDEAALTQARHHGFVVVDVVRFVGVDEDEVECAFEPADRLERRAQVDLDPAGMWTLLDVSTRDGCATLVELARIDPAA